MDDHKFTTNFDLPATNDIEQLMAADKARLEVGEELLRQTVSQLRFDFDSVWDSPQYSGRDTDLCDMISDVLLDEVAEVIDLEILADTFQFWARCARVSPDGFIYALTSGEFTKIGRAKQPNHRIKSLKIQLPFAVDVFTVIPCEDYVACERFLHRIYKNKRANGEWFRLNQQDLVWLSDIKFMVQTENDPERDEVTASRYLPKVLRNNESWMQAIEKATRLRERKATELTEV